MRNWLPTPIHPKELTHLRDGETAMLSALREIAGRGYILVKDVSSRSKPAAGSALYEVGAIPLPLSIIWLISIL